MGLTRKDITTMNNPLTQDTIADALKVVRGILAEVRPGPERITAADPAAVTADWDAELTLARADKMDIIVGQVRLAARMLGVLHQLPQVLLIAPDGAAIELFGARTGTAVVIPATLPPP